MIDLHCHTNASDGEKSPEELINLAIHKSITALAITDHDTIDGLQSAERYAKDKKILFIPGIELEAKVDKGQMHILGLFINYNNGDLKKYLLQIIEDRNIRNNKFIVELNNMGFKISIDDLKNVSGGKTIGKPHFAKVFLNKNYIRSKNEMFDKYFNRPPLDKYQKNTYPPKEIINLIKKANGITILAHPQTLKLNDTDFIKTIKELKSYELDGIECYHSNQTFEEMEKYKKIAQDFDLLISKGSDYHGPIIKPSIELGTGINNNILSSNEDELILHNLLASRHHFKSTF